MQAGLPSPASAWRAWLHATSPGPAHRTAGLAADLQGDSSCLVGPVADTGLP